MDNQTYIVKFDGEDLADANRYAAELRDTLLEVASDTGVNVEANVRRDDPSTMDFGGTLVLVLGTPAAIAIAKGFADWLRKRNTASVTIETGDGKLVAKNISSKDAASLAGKFGREESGT